MQTDILIIGGGISGLMATWQLQQAGVRAMLIEARSRLGGRIATIGKDSGANCDLGPSWVWPGQPLVADLLKTFGLRHYEQYASGDILFQDADETIHRLQQPSPMAGAWRVEGGLQQLTDALVAQLAPGSYLTEHTASIISRQGEGVCVEVVHKDDLLPVQATRVALAIPPRLATQLEYEPVLPDSVLQQLAATPTWMGGHAKFFAVYSQPFWREQGLCGTAICRSGILGEIHDASPDSGERYCLFGFLRADASQRATLGEQDCTRRAVEQLAALFGQALLTPEAVYFQDWSDEPLTAAPADRLALHRHPDYGLNLNPEDEWEGRLDFISTEAAFNHGGLIEGALESGLRYARRIIAEGI